MNFHDGFQFFIDTVSITEAVSGSLAAVGCGINSGGINGCPAGGADAGVGLP